MGIQGRRWVAFLVLAVIVVTVAACGGTPASGSAPASNVPPSAAPTASAAPSASPASSGPPSAAPTVSPSPSRTAVATPSPSAERTPPARATPTAGTLCTTGGRAAAGAKLAITDPDASVRLPDGWVPVPIDDYAAMVRQASGQVDDPRVRKSLTWQLELIDAGVTRIAASGIGSVLMSVLPPLGDLRTTVDARVNDMVTNGIPVKVVDVVESDVPAGPAWCTAFTSDIEIGTPAQTIEYIVLMPTGEIVAISGTAPVTDTDFPALVRSIALSLGAD